MFLPGAVTLVHDWATCPGSFAWNRSAGAGPRAAARAPVPWPTSIPGQVGLRAPEHAQPLRWRRPIVAGAIAACSVCWLASRPSSTSSTSRPSCPDACATRPGGGRAQASFDGTSPSDEAAPAARSRGPGRTSDEWPEQTVQRPRQQHDSSRTGGNPCRDLSLSSPASGPICPWWHSRRKHRTGVSMGSSWRVGVITSRSSERWPSPTTAAASGHCSSATGSAAGRSGRT